VTGDNSDWDQLGRELKEVGFERKALPQSLWERNLSEKEIRDRPSSLVGAGWVEKGGGAGVHKKGGHPAG